MLNKIKNFGKGIKSYMEKKIKAIKETLSIPQNRLISGLVLVGAGTGLILSAYTKVPI